MLDEYIFGRATRISQEAPVMVVKQSSTRAVPGGAANVAANIVALGGQASLVGVVGQDRAGEMLSDALASLSAKLIPDPSRPTTRKLRILANHAHQVLRIDHEEERGVDPIVEDRLIQAFRESLPAAQVVLISDYQKGGVTPRIVQEVISHARQSGVPVVANPKPKSLPHYKGASLVSLNRFEASEALGLAGAVSDDEAAEGAMRLRDRLDVERVLITLGGSGMVAAGASSYRADAIKVDLYDEAGAGDTVIATIALGIAAGHFGSDLLNLAARTAGAVVQKVGVAVPSPEDLQALG
jgi:D-beta-D-heptose 7-phosphate kinase/D-beta-D-heptose 1-phosphate adenosyltransferase